MGIAGKRKTCIGLIVLMGFLVSIFLVGNALAAEKDTITFGLVGQMVPDYTTDLDDMDVEWPSKMTVYEGLVRYKPGTLEIEPCLATDWEVSEDGKEITFHLRKGVQFHKGFGELTAEDVKATYERVLDLDKWTYVAEIKDDWADLDHVEVVDKYTVKLYLKNPDYTWFTYLLPHYTGVVTSKQALEKFGVEGTKTNAIGTGPYELVEWTPMDKIKLKRFDGYWGEKPSVENLEFVSFGDDMAAEKALTAGKIDIMKPSRESLQKLAKDPNIKLMQFPGGGFGWFGLNTRKPPMDNIKMRLAVAHAININEILKFIRAEYAEDPTTLRAVSAMPAYFQEACPEAMCPPYKYDPEKAKQLLKEAGYKGEKIEIGASPPGDMDDAATILQGQLQSVGINCSVTSLEKHAFWDATTGWDKEGQFHIFAEQWYGYVAAPSLAVLNWICGEDWNLMKWCNKDFDEKFGTVKQIPTREERAKLYQELQKMMNDEVVAVWIDHGAETWAYNKRIDVGVPLPSGYFLPQSMKIVE